MIKFKKGNKNASFNNYVNKYVKDFKTLQCNSFKWQIGKAFYIYGLFIFRVLALHVAVVGNFYM